MESEVIEGDSVFSPSMDVDDLPDDALLLIFEAVPLRDRLNIDCVSKRWRTLSHYLWPRTKELDMMKEIYAFKQSLGLKKMEERVACDMFLMFLQRIRGKNSGVTSLKSVGG